LNTINVMKEILSKPQLPFNLTLNNAQYFKTLSVNKNLFF